MRAGFLGSNTFGTGNAFQSVFGHLGPGQVSTRTNGSGLAQENNCLAPICPGPNRSFFNKKEIRKFRSKQLGCIKRLDSGPLRGGPGGTFGTGPGIFWEPEILRLLRVKNFVKSLKEDKVTPLHHLPVIPLTHS